MIKAVQKSTNGWIKFLRVLFYVISIIGVTVGTSLIKTGGRSESYADGTYVAKIQNGEIIFFTALIVLSVNIIWGILRWFLRGYREQWTAGRIIGKLIGGGLWRAAAIIPLILISIFFIAPQISNIISANSALAEQAPISLSEPYERLKNLNSNLENLNPEELEHELSELMFNNIDFGLDASGNISRRANSFFSSNVSAYSSTVTTLNRAKLSSLGHFVVFYTDIGDDQISDAKAAELAEMLETIIAGYKDNLDFDYEYEKLNNNTAKLKKIQNVLMDANIDENILDSAMPVYVVNPYKNGSSTLASYAGRRFKDLGAAILIKVATLFGEETAELYNSTPSYPFINILPSNADSESLAIVTAHELGHHYAGVYNYNTYGKTGSDDNFIDETAPNWMAINVLPSQPATNLINDNHYNYSYLSKSTSYKISEASPNFLGYPPVAFLQNYYEIVPNAKTIIMDAVFYGDALNYLYEKAGTDNYQKVMVNLAERNLTGDYGGKLTNTVRPKGESLSCADVCSKNYFINPSATKYLYFATSEHQNTRITFSGDSDILGSIIGIKYDGNFGVLSSGIAQKDILISEDELKNYEVIAFAVANTSISKQSSFIIDIIAKELEDLIATAGDFDFGSIYSELQPGCYEIDTDSLFDNLANLVSLGSDFLAALDRLSSEDYSEVRSAYDESSVEVKDSIFNTKSELSPYRVSVCANYIGSSQSFDEVKRRLQSALGYSLNFYDERDGAERFSVFAGFDLFSRSGHVYILAESEGEMGLAIISIDPR